MSDRANIYVYQNTDYETPIEFFDEDGPIDVSDYVFHSQIRKIYSSNLLAEFDFVTNDAANGNIEIRLPSEVTSTLMEGKYQYDILAQHNSGDVIKVLEGIIYIMPTITRIE